MSNSDKVFVAWVALALTLALPASPLRLLTPTEGASQSEISAVSESQQHHGEGELPSSSPSDEQAEQLLDLLEDDEVIHERHNFALPWLRSKPTLVAQLDPDSLHTREFERPPLRIA